MFGGHTVTVYALQLAAYLGYNPIYLIGCDTDYTIPEDVEQDGIALTSTMDNDHNHFSTSYFGKGAKWSVPRPDLMIEGYERLQIAFTKRGVRVYNATVGGKLEVFERACYKEVLKVSPMGLVEFPDSRP